MDVAHTPELVDWSFGAEGIHLGKIADVGLSVPYFLTIYDIFSALNLI